MYVYLNPLPPLYQIRWYNEMRKMTSPDNTQLIQSDNLDAVGVIYISNAKFFSKVVQSFDASSPSSNFVTDVVDSVMKSFLGELDRDLKPEGFNTDRPPYIHVQTVGHVAGIAEYVSPETEPNDELVSQVSAGRDADLWGSLQNKILGVSIHPKYGGWFAYRILVVLHGAIWPQEIPQPTALKFLAHEDQKYIISEYNKNADLAKWRDIHDLSSGLMVGYDTAQYSFFHEKSIHKRRRILEMLKAESYGNERHKSLEYFHQL